MWSLTFGITGCGAGPSLDAPTSTERIVISPVNVRLTIGESEHLTARVVGADERDVAGASIVWASQQPQVVAVSYDGTVTALSVGTAQIVARAGTVSASAVVTVTSPSIPSLSIGVSSARSVLWVSDTLTAVATVRIGGSIASHADIQWISSRPDIVGLSQAGVMRGIAPGVSIITALSSTVSASLSMTVVPTGALHIEGAQAIAPGWEAELALHGSKGESYAGPAQWRSDDSSVATVSSVGVVHALHAGTTIIHSMAIGQARDLSVTVRPLAGRIGVARGGALALLALDESQTVVTPRRDGAPLTWPHMAVSPDGHQVAYDCGEAICREPLDASQRVEVVFSRGSFPSWTADGRTLAARTDYAEVGLSDIATGSISRLRTIRYVDRPRVAPDGRSIAYDCDYTDPYEDLSDVCLTPVGGGMRGSLLLAHATRMAWSSDGASIAYLSGDGVCVSAVNGGPPCTLVLPANENNGLSEISWSPDSRQLVITRGLELWIVDADGGNRTRQVAALYDFTSPSWSASP